MVYCSLVRSVKEYASVAFSNIPSSLSKRLKSPRNALSVLPSRIKFGEMSKCVNSWVRADTQSCAKVQVGVMRLYEPSNRNIVLINISNRRDHKQTQHIRKHIFGDESLLVNASLSVHFLKQNKRIN